jgi:glycosyltransferase involved in cell wall biosynthesis
MRLIINLTNIRRGGAMQVASSLISELASFETHDFIVIIHPSLLNSIFEQNNDIFFIEIKRAVIESKRLLREKLSSIEGRIKPDCVFTLFGPAYWRPKSMHIVGFADGWCYNPTSIAFKKLTLIRRLLVKAKVIYKVRSLKNEADFVVVETEAAKNNIIKYLNLVESRIFIVGNTFHPVFEKFEHRNEALESDSELFKFITISSYYPHKNLTILNEVIPLLRSRTRIKFLFTLTIEQTVFTKKFIKDDYIKNIGPVSIFQCPNLYETADALFLPTLLETFTASYPEAMKMRRPILTSDLSFAHDLCGESALFFNPLDPIDIAEKIIELAGNRRLYQELIQRGEKRLDFFETSKSRANKYLDIISKVSN